MEYIPDHPQEKHLILCCCCGSQIEPNSANMCVGCLRTQVDITTGIPKQSTIYFCRNCERYQQQQTSWIVASLESRELLALCLKKIKGLKTVRLVDAGFIWTEPHSKRLKVKLSIQKEVLTGTVLEQTFVVEFIVHNQMCEDCHRVEAKDYWKAVVQIRQKTGHKKTLYYLEQLILKHKAHVNTTSIKQYHEGLDFYYGAKKDARKLVEFLVTVVPCRYQTAQELISHDINSNTYNYKTTYSVEIVPVCKDNIVCLAPKLAQQLGNMGQVVVVSRVTQAMHLIDPATCQVAEVSGVVYWRMPFVSLCEPKQLQEYMIMEIEIVSDSDVRHVSGSGRHSNKHVLAQCWVVKASELGLTDQQYHCQTHLGHLLHPGDIALGFDLKTSNVNDKNLDRLNQSNIPDVVLVKKLYANSEKRNRKRKWKLHHLDLQHAASSENRDYNDFLEDLEEDAEFRQNINIYKNLERIAVAPSDTDDDDVPQISLAEMLDDLHLDEDATGGEGADMIE